MTTTLERPAPGRGHDRAAEVIRAVGHSHRRRHARERATVALGIGGLAVALLLFWQFGIGLFVNTRYVSDPVTVGARLVELVREGEIFRHLTVTVLEAGAGFVLGSVLALLAAFLLSLVPRWYDLLEPFLIAFYSIPKIALAPLFILWFGLGYTPKVLLAALMVFFIVFMNTASGIRDVQPGLIQVSRVFGASRRDIMRKVLLPAASPAIVASVRITFTRAIEGAVLAEFIGSTEGLGFLIVRASRNFDIPTMFAGILVIAIVVMVANLALRVVETRLLPWHTREVHG